VSDHVEDFERDGIAYRITVRPVKGGFEGSWVCLDDGQSGASSHVDKSVEAAVTGAKANLSPHHFHCHASGSED
jgi:hypothetical protein